MNGGARDCTCLSRSGLLGKQGHGGKLRGAWGWQSRLFVEPHKPEKPERQDEPEGPGTSLFRAAPCRMREFTLGFCLTGRGHWL